MVDGQTLDFCVTNLYTGNTVACPRVECIMYVLNHAYYFLILCILPLQCLARLKCFYAARVFSFCLYVSQPSPAPMHRGIMSISP